MPPSSSTPLDEWFVLPERAFFEELEARARRIELLAALLQAKGIPPERGVRALQASLGAIAASSENAQLPSVGALARALASALEHVGIIVESSPAGRSLDVLVLDESEVSRDLVALAAEAEGHIVRSAGSYEDFIRQLDERLPDLIVTEVEHEKARADQFTTGLAELLVTRPVPVIYFSSVERDVLDGLSSAPNVRAAVRKADGITALMNALARLVEHR